jgi:formylglycine-generating enzyme required for sulfatase activity
MLLLGLLLAQAGPACERGTGLPDHWPGATAGMVAIAGARFTPGSTHGYAEERPAGPVQVARFFIDRTEVTNAQFATFAKATGYRTMAERAGGSAVFAVPEGAAREEENAWWRWVPGADWRHPEGPGSDVAARPHHPVVHIARADALAYARWLGHDLPSEAEWELAARGGASDDREPRDRRGPRANYWQGDFPFTNTREDGYAGTAPVGCFPPNRHGLYDAIGNVWEWTRDDDRTWAERADPRTAPGTSCHASAPHDGAAAGRGIIKGGSHLCAASYCVRFRAAARHAQEVDMTASHLGFRTVFRPRGKE